MSGSIEVNSVLYSTHRAGIRPHGNAKYQNGQEEQPVSEAGDNLTSSKKDEHCAQEDNPKTKLYWDLYPVFAGMLGSQCQFSDDYGDDVIRRTEFDWKLSIN